MRLKFCLAPLLSAQSSQISRRPVAPQKVSETVFLGRDWGTRSRFLHKLSLDGSTRSSGDCVIYRQRSRTVNQRSLAVTHPQASAKARWSSAQVRIYRLRLPDLRMKNISQVYFYEGQNCIQRAAYLQVAVNIFQFCPNNVNYSREEFSKKSTEKKLGVGVKLLHAAMKCKYHKAPLHGLLNIENIM